MINRIIIHIGIEKTATTSLQDFLRKNDHELLKHGYFLPNAAGEFNQVLFAKLFRRGPEGFLRRHGIFTTSKQAKMRDRLEHDLEEEISQLGKTPEAMIITSEWLHSKLTKSDEINALGDFLKKFAKKIEVVCYLKEQSALANSKYTTSLRYGLSPSFEEFIKECRPRVTYYNHLQTLSRWSEIASGENLKCRVFSKRDLKEGSISVDFLDQLGVDFKNGDWKETPTLNQSLSFNGAMIFRALNETLAGSNIPWKYKNVISDALSGSHNFVTEAEYNQISEEFSFSNEEVRERFFPNRKTLFERQNSFSKSHLLEAELYPEFLSAVQAILTRSGNQFNENVVQEICNLS